MLRDLYSANAPDDKTIMVKLLEYLATSGMEPSFKPDEATMALVSVATGLYRRALMDAICELMEKNNQELVRDLGGQIEG